MPVTSSNFGELLEPVINGAYGLEYKRYPDEYPSIFDVKGSTRAYEEMLSIAGFGQAPIKSEGQSIPYVEPKQGFLSRLTHVTYGQGFIVSREMYEDELYNQIKAMARHLGKSLRETTEVVAANVLNRAFNNSYLGSDGLELCSTAHLLEQGGTMQNEPTTPADFSEESLRTALVDIADFRDGAGLKTQVRPIRLIVAPDGDFQASRILESTLQPESANNDINPAKGRVPYVVNHYLSDPDAWFLITDCPDSLCFYWRRRSQFGLDNDFDSENAKYKATMRFSAGWHDFRGVYGNPGA
jgi:hypothetical protein